jgi:hypothetical protein
MPSLEDDAATACGINTVRPSLRRRGRNLLYEMILDARICEEHVRTFKDKERLQAPSFQGCFGEVDTSGSQAPTRKIKQGHNKCQPRYGIVQESRCIVEIFHIIEGFSRCWTW